MTITDIANDFGVRFVSDAPSDGSSPDALVSRRALPRNEARALAAALVAAGHVADDVLDTDDEALAWVYATPSVSLTADNAARVQQ